MTASHIAAALLAAWSLQRADTACSAAAERLGEAIADLLVQLHPLTPPVATPRVLRPSRSRTQWLPPVTVFIAPQWGYRPSGPA
ncbi:hypothetical protein BBN63_00415 [Streptomyces niveus]|uniref:Uncharacterized protein n=1 Tax=Streptomyces niveus TaxID=193462 RepID=A0A1U9QLA2_STRNV|nr:hypothetical protein BBN63_00415 [Streptomyces niveus]